MIDVFHEWAGDVVANSSGDLTVADGTDAINQRLYRRLLTNPGDYIWNLDYGAGLGRFVGDPANHSIIQAVVLEQLSLETAIPSVPPPRVETQFPTQGSGLVNTRIVYSSPQSSAPVVIDIPTG